jgi:hypothetical protein
VYCIRLGVYRPKFGAMVLPPHAAELAAMEVTSPVGIRPLPTFGRALRSPGSQACDDGHAQVAAQSF